MTITTIKLSDINKIESIGKKCLPIYYSSFDILFLLYNHNYVLFKINEGKTVGLLKNSLKDAILDGKNKNDKNASIKFLEKEAKKIPTKVFIWRQEAER